MTMNCQQTWGPANQHWPSNPHKCVLPANHGAAHKCSCESMSHSRLAIDHGKHASRLSSTKAYRDRFAEELQNFTFKRPTPGPRHAAFKLPGQDYWNLTAPIMKYPQNHKGPKVLVRVIAPEETRPLTHGIFKSIWGTLYYRPQNGKSRMLSENIAVTVEKVMEMNPYHTQAAHARSLWYVTVRDLDNDLKYEFHTWRDDLLISYTVNTEITHILSPAELPAYNHHTHMMYDEHPTVGEPPSPPHPADDRQPIPPLETRSRASLSSLGEGSIVQVGRQVFIRLGKYDNWKWRVTGVAYKMDTLDMLKRAKQFGFTVLRDTTLNPGPVPGSVILDQIVLPKAPPPTITIPMGYKPVSTKLTKLNTYDTPAHQRYQNLTDEQVNSIGVDVSYQPIHAPSYRTPFVVDYRNGWQWVATVREAKALAARAKTRGGLA